jgi:uncharacterized Ntn-hydrolase superfamily protein
VTLSIVARGLDETSLGVAVASRFLAVGAMVPAAEAGVGALATQARANLSYKRDGLSLLRDGRSAREVVSLLTGRDPLAEHRQLGVVDSGGFSASFTGSACQAWAGGRSGPGYAVQGNILAGEEVVAEMEKAWLAGGATEAEAEGAGGGPIAAATFAGQLLGVLAAGEAAGGDRRGRESAAILVVSPGAGYGGSDVAVDLRVDDHPDPVAELGRLLELHALYFGKASPRELLALRGALLHEVAHMLGKLGYPLAEEGEGVEVGAVIAALRDWAGFENLEERVGAEPELDPLVLEILRARAGHLALGNGA